MADFAHEDLSGSTFERVKLQGAVFRSSNLSGAKVIGCYFEGSEFRGVEMHDVAITGEFDNVTINGVEIGPIIEAELDRRYPDRSKMRPTTAAGFREAWSILERLWEGTVERARALPPQQLHESVNGEWSFIETLRHLAFATETWILRAMRGQPAPWQPLSLPWDEMRDTPGVPRDRTARPSLEEALALRQGRQRIVREVMLSLTDDQLDELTPPIEGPGFPAEGQSFPVRECLFVVVNEEWEHRLFAERDLDILTGATAG
jgi:hypothetical protein